MAGFKTHITVSTVLGAGYGAGAWWAFGVPPPTCVLAAGLCSVSGMLPDIDSDSGVPFRESMAFAAAVVPMLMIERFAHLGWAPETMVLIGGLIYLAIRFGLATLLRKYTVHRGMFHSIPAALIAGQVAFLVCADDNLELRYYKAVAVVVGFLSHLLLDELYSIEWYRGRIRLKKSFGTAMKFWGTRSIWANVSTYGKLILLTYVVLRDPVWMDRLAPYKDPVHHMADGMADQVIDRVWR